MTDTRYQFQPWYVKAYRQLRHRPKWLTLFVWWVICWVWRGCQIPGRDWPWFPTRRSYLAHLWVLSRSHASADMRHLYTFPELMDRLKARGIE
jgi:hypothetical protein